MSERRKEEGEKTGRKENDRRNQKQSEIMVAFFL